MPKKPIEIPEWCEQELRNWARWCWRGAYPHPIPAGHCGSLEWQYQRINEEGTTESVDDKPIPVNEHNAAIVQGVYETLPWLQAQVLRAEYPQRHSGARHRLKVGREEYEAALSAACYKVMGAFDCQFT